jgi:hypothetical protein
LFFAECCAQPDAALNNKTGIFCLLPSCSYEVKFLESDVQQSRNHHNTTIEENSHRTKTFAFYIKRALSMRQVVMSHIMTFLVND